MARRFWFFLTLAVALAGSPAKAQPERWAHLSGWRPGPELQTARAGLGAIALDGVIYAAGGSGLTAPRDEVEALDPAFNRWRGLEPLPDGLERFGMAAAAGRIWIAGGYGEASGSDPVTAVWSLSPNENVWRAEPSLPGPKAAFSLVALEHRLYAVGGEAGAAGVFVFDVQAGAWSALDAPLETNRRGAAAVAHDGKIYLIGGLREGETLARVDVFDPAAGIWRRGADMPAPRAGHAAVAQGGALHVLGGRSADLRRTLDEYWIYDPDGDRWRAGPALGAPRTEAAAVIVDGSIYVIGGGAGSGFFAPFTAVSSVEVLSLEGR